MKRVIGISLAVLAALAIALAAALAWFLEIGPALRRADEFSRLVAVSWGDGKYGKAIYGAYVFYEPQEDGRLRVMLRVHIDRGSRHIQYASTDRPLGIARNPTDAVDKWGVIAWSDAGITVGRAEHAYLYPRAELERHR